MNITKEQIDNLNAVVKVAITKEDYQDKVDSILKDYKKQANIPGFRKGQVPMGLIKKQYGKAVLVDEVNKLLQDNLNKYLTEEKLDVLGNPLPKQQDNFDWDQEELAFEFELGLAPDFEVSLKTKKAITQYKIVFILIYVNTYSLHCPSLGKALRRLMRGLWKLPINGVFFD